MSGSLAVTADYRHFYAQGLQAGTELVKLNTIDDPPTVTIPTTGLYTWDFDITPVLGRIAVIAKEDDGFKGLLVLSTDTDTPTRIPLPEAFAPRRLAIDPNGHYAYVTDMGLLVVWIVDLDAGRECGSIDLTSAGIDTYGFSRIGIGWDWD
ncbi:hypothetical protein [Streptomyces hiroshimensis]